LRWASAARYWVELVLGWVITAAILAGAISFWWYVLKRAG